MRCVHEVYQAGRYYTALWQVYIVLAAGAGDQIQRLLINEFPNFLHSTKLPFLTILSKIHQTILVHGKNHTGPH